ncbi:MAG TPA: hypothetical protein VMT69_02400, partial [Kineosporiaceae bacterium]|nr:hypothetical protein [Kineosporiaceae bacterium]
MRNSQEFRRVERKANGLRMAKRFSVPDEPGSRVAIMMLFIPGLAHNGRDGYESFEQDACELVAQATATGREPVLRMRASVADFAEVMTDPTVASVVVRGFGSFSAVSTPLWQGRDVPYGMLDWRILAGMADHLKLGSFVMRTCASLSREFNPPLPFGVVSSHRNIHAAVGRIVNVV